MVKDIKGQKVTLRDLTDADLNDYRKWFTKGLEWTKWDAPWEEMSDTFAQDFVQRLFTRLSKGPQEIKTRLEIEVDGTHIGWVSSYNIERKPDFLAVGISIPEDDFWAGKHCDCGLDTYLRTVDWNTFTVKHGQVMKGWCVWLFVSVSKLLKKIRFWNITVCSITNSNSGLARYLLLKATNDPKRNN